jgi:hypothetical protein
VVLESVIVEPTQPFVTPVIAPTVGRAFTVTGEVEADEQPFAVTVYVIVAVPAVRPVTSPKGLTLATAGLEVVQTPFGFVLASAVVAPTHKEVAPVIGAPEVELIVSVLVAVFVQPFVVTV